MARTPFWIFLVAGVTPLPENPPAGFAARFQHGLDLHSFPGTTSCWSAIPSSWCCSGWPHESGPLQIEMPRHDGDNSWAQTPQVRRLCCITSLKHVQFPTFSLTGRWSGVLKKKRQTVPWRPRTPGVPWRPRTLGVPPASACPGAACALTGNRVRCTWSRSLETSEIFAVVFEGVRERNRGPIHMGRSVHPHAALN